MSLNDNNIATFVNLLNQFNSTAFAIVKICRQVAPDDVNVEHLQKLLGLARSIDEEMIIKRSEDKIWHYREQILEENTEFFMNQSFSQFIKKDDNENFLNCLLKLIKERFAGLSVPEQKKIWTLIKSLLVHVIEYKKLKNEYRL